MTRGYIVGSSIDGTVYRTVGGWTSMKSGRAIFEKSAFQPLVDEMRAANARRAADEAVGRLQFVPMTDAELDALAEQRFAGRKEGERRINGLEFRRRVAMVFRLEWLGETDPRRMKREERRHESLVEDARNGGSCAREGARNPFPPGLRHDAWQDGYLNRDPMGDMMGRNA